MKSILLWSFFLLCAVSTQAQTLFFEDFNSASDGATSGTATGTAPAAQRAWSVTQAPSSGTFSKQTYGSLERFTINQTGTNEGVWSTAVISIPAGKQVAIDISLVTYNAGPSDYVRAYYKLDGGSEVLFGSAIGGNYIISAGASIVLSGTTVQVVVRGKENTAGDDGNGNPNMMRFDDVEVTAVTTLYSATTGNWGTNGTWSSVAVGGTPCTCTPDDLTNVVVGSTHVVSITGAATAVNITVQNSSTLRWTTDNVSLTAARGGSITISNTASLDRNGNAGANVIFPSAAPVALTVNSSSATAFSPGDLTVNGAATMTISGTGAITLGDDFLVNAAANITNNLTGTLTVTDDINFNTDNASFTNNRTVTAGDLIVNDNGDDANTFTNASGATLNVGTITPNDGNFILNNAGTINQSGNFNVVDPGSSYTNQATGIWNWTYAFGTGNDASMNTVLNCSTSGNTFNYSAAGNQIIIPVQYHHLSLSTSNNKSINAAIDINGNLLIQNTANFNTNNFAVNVGGNFTVSNTATYTEGTNTTTFDGSSNQTISSSAAAGEMFYLMVVNKPGGALNLSSNTTVTSTTGTGLTLTQGVINSSSSALLIINDNVTTNGGDADSFVDGPVQKIGDDAFVFPTGDGTRWARIGISNLTSATAGSRFTAQYFTTPYSSFTTNGTFDHVSGAEYWTLDRTINTPSAAVTLYWESSFSQINNLTYLIVARHNGTNWNNEGKASTTGVAAGPGTITSNSVSSFSPFSFGSTAGGTINPLPVQLMSFKARLVNDHVNLDWQTASELNNASFSIERAINIESFEKIGEDIAGHGTTNETHSYSYVDYTPLYGRTYYRLKQTDFDGASTYSSVQVVDYEGPSFATLQVYPNPYSISKTNLIVELRGLKDVSTATLEMINSQGQPVFTKVIEIKAAGSIREPITFDKPIPAGLYIIRAGTTPFLTQKIVVE